MFPVMYIYFQASDESIFGKIGSAFEIVIEKQQFSNQNEKAKALVGSKVKGRIIHVNPKTKQVGISLQPELLSLSKDLIDKSFNVGEILDECEVLDKTKAYGLLMKLPDNKFGSVHVRPFLDYSFFIKYNNYNQYYNAFQ